MKKVAYLLAVCLVGLSCMTAQPAFAAETHSSIISPVAESRSIYTVWLRHCRSLFGVNYGKLR